MTRLFLVSALGAVLGLGCVGSGWPEVADPRELGPTVGGPQIDRIRDMGNPDLPRHGAIVGADPDGVATPGELLLIEGSGFGKQPTVFIGGRAAGLLARADNGGIVVRVPTAIGSGMVPVDVSTPKGHSQARVSVRRYALVCAGENNHLHVLEVGKEAHPFGHPIELPAARLLRFAYDGSAAYVVAADGTGHAQLHTIDMTAAHGPRHQGVQDLAERAVFAMASADAAPRLVVVGSTHVTLYDLTATKRPSRWSPLALPEPVVKAQVVAAELDPEGKTLALLSAHGNHVFIFDLSDPRQLRLVTTVDVLPDARTPLVRDMQFSIDGETLWVVSGDNALSLSAGPQPTKLSAIRLLPPTDKQGARVISVWRTMPVPGASAPIGLAVSRGQPLASGTTIRIPPEKAAVFVSGVNAQLLKLDGVALASAAGARRASALLSPIAQPGMMVRADINGGGGPMFATPQVLSAVDLTPDAQVVVATACRAVASGGVLDISFGVVSTPLWGKPAPQFVALEKVSPEFLRPPFHLGSIRIQP